jgi:hypothetical protein
VLRVSLAGSLAKRLSKSPERPGIVTHGGIPLGRPPFAGRPLVDVPLGEERRPLRDQRELARDEERSPAGHDGHNSNQVARVALDASVLGPLRVAGGRESQSLKWRT